MSWADQLNHVASFLDRHADERIGLIKMAFLANAECLRAISSELSSIPTKKQIEGVILAILSEPSPRNRQLSILDCGQLTMMDTDFANLVAERLSIIQPEQQTVKQYRLVLMRWNGSQPGHWEEQVENFSNADDLVTSLTNHGLPMRFAEVAEENGVSVYRFRVGY